MVDVLDILIDKQDNSERVRDQIAVILATESANQQALAAGAGKDPEGWKFSVYIERARPWEALFSSVDDEGRIKDETPLVNVWYDNGTFPQAKGDTVERQTESASYNIDIYAAAVSVDSVTPGYESGDELATLEAQRITRLVRNILMSNINTYLQLRGIVGRRWPSSITSFQPQQNENNAQYVTAVRLVLSVDFLEFSPQLTPEDLEEIFIEVKKAQDGSVLAAVQFDLTT